MFHRLGEGKPKYIKAAIMMPGCAKALEKKGSLAHREGNIA
jgi:hypothetical protein